MICRTCSTTSYIYNSSFVMYVILQLIIHDSHRFRIKLYDGFILVVELSKAFTLSGMGAQHKGHSMLALSFRIICRHSRHTRYVCTSTAQGPLRRIQAPSTPLSRSKHTTNLQTSINPLIIPSIRIKPSIAVTAATIITVAVGYCAAILMTGFNFGTCSVFFL